MDFEIERQVNRVARPRKMRRVCTFPEVRRFAPAGSEQQTNPIVMTVDEYETVRLIDRESLSQEDCARRMGVARTTVQLIYASARRKLADMLVEGAPLMIQGGEYHLCDGGAACGDSGCLLREIQTRFQKPKGECTMRIAVTYENGEIFQHFGHTRQFKVYDVQNGAIVSSEIVDTNGSGHGALAGVLGALNVDALICGGIGGGAQMALAEAGIRLYGGVSGSADEAAQALAAGTLAFNPDVKCDHHGEHHHGEGHSCGEHGCGSHGCGQH